jgi:hypothetical protein
MGDCLQVILLFVGLIASTTCAQEVGVKDDLGGGPLEITSIIDAKTLSLSRNIRLTAVGTDIKDLQLLPSDLAPAVTGQLSIDRSNVSIPAGTNLSDSVPRDVRVTVQNVIRPGDYSGTLTFVALPTAGKTRPPDHQVTIKVHAIARPDVRVSEAGASNALYSYRVHWPATAWLFSEWLMPAQLVGESRSLSLDNRTPAPVRVTRAEVTLYGERRGAGAEQYVSIDPALTTLKEFSPELVTLKIDRDRIAADHYHGTVRLYVENADEPVVIPFTLDVRNGPKAALLILLVGIAVGRFVRNSPPTGSVATGAVVAGPAPSAAAKAVAKTFAFVSGSSQTVIQQGRWVQAASFALLLGLLVLWGFQSLYLSNGTTFGAGGLYDYLGLFLWGLSADVAQRTLQNLPLH